MLLFYCGLYIGIGLGVTATYVVQYGWPSDWQGWLNCALCPMLWPIALYRGRHG